MKIIQGIIGKCPGETSNQLKIAREIEKKNINQTFKDTLRTNKKNPEENS